MERLEYRTYVPDDIDLAFLGPVPMAAEELASTLKNVCAVVICMGRFAHKEWAVASFLLIVPYIADDIVSCHWS
jgi:hypothetical protein